MKTKILMVCLGNICRSPLAEGILTNKLDPNYVLVDSAGTAGYHLGKKPDPRSIAIAKKYGIDISQQRCRKFEVSDFEIFDHIYVMDKSNYDDIISLTKNNKDRKKVSLLLDQSGSNLQEVPDPYYGGDEGFEQVYHLIDEACTMIAKELNAK